MSRFKLLGICVVALLIAKGGFAPPATTARATQRLTVREEPGRVVLAWSGPVAEPMQKEIAAALDRFKADPRRLVLTLNSPGGSVQQGHAVMATVREAARLRPIGMHVENGAACASMCVPIYLTGTERTADPGGQFMFHEVSLGSTAGSEDGRKAPVAPMLSREAVEALATDLLYRDDLGGKRVDAHWLGEMRRRIAGRDVWVTARQLMDERSGVVDALVPTAVQ